MHDTTPRTHILVGCVAASLGLLLLKPLDPNQMSMIRGGLVGPTSPYPAAAAAALGLLAWRLAPRHAWAWLLVAGAVCTVPTAAMTVDPNLLTTSNHELLTALVDGGTVFTLIGILDAATLVWHAGRRAAGAALTGAAMGLRLVGSTAELHAESILDEDLHTTMTVALAAVGLVAAAVAVFVRQLPECAPPRWRVTLAGAVLAAAPVIHYLWDPISTTGRPSDYFLWLTLILATLGLVAGAAGGVAILLASIATGLMLGIFGMLLVLSSAVVPSQGLLASLLVGGCGAGYLLALSRLRTTFGVGGLVVVAIGLVSLFPRSSGTAGASLLDVLAPVLVAVAVISVVVATASMGDALAERSESPAVFAGLAVPFTFALYAFATNEWATQGPIERQPADLLLLAAGGLVVAALALLTVALRRPPADDPGVSATSPVAEPVHDGTRT